MKELKIINKNIDEIKEYEHNAKEHLKWQIELIANSIKEFGFNDPIAINADNQIIEGHGRLLAAKQLGLIEVPCIVLTGLTEAQERAYIIVHNKTTMNTDFDLERLQYELNALKVEGFDLTLTGFSNDEIDRLLNQVDNIEENQEELKEDYEEIEVEKIVIKTGDYIELGRHRLLCGDSTNENDVKKLLSGEKVNMIFTDPPYGYNYQSNSRKQKMEILLNDDKKLDFFSIAKKYNKGFLFVCASWKNIKEWIEIFEKYFKLTNLIIWNKGGGGIGDLEHTFSTDYEMILVASQGEKLTGKRIGSVWDIKKDSGLKYLHPTQKPVELSALAIKSTTNERDKILDLFGGSGSTLIACEQLNRSAYLMELEPKWVQIIIERYLKFTNDKFIKINGEEVNWIEYKVGDNNC